MSRMAIFAAAVAMLLACQRDDTVYPVYDYLGPDMADTVEMVAELAPETTPEEPKAPEIVEVNDLGAELWDVGMPDGAVDLGIIPGDAGWPCAIGDDCLSGFCIQTPAGKQCTIGCIEECPFDWVCVQHQPSLPDEIYICTPLRMNLCKPCAKNSDCLTNGVETGDACLPYGPAGEFCGSVCMGEEDCPDGYDCKKVLDVWGYESNQCVLADGECQCEPWFVDEQAATGCTVANQHGECQGQRVCKAEGLTDCDAPSPAQETCNGQDDDCDGDVDENAGGDTCFAENDFGACKGIYSCANGELACDAPAPEAEQCDALDNDCDGLVDEGFVDSDKDGIADCLENDKDGDGILDFQDNCEYTPNPNQDDFDLDTVGDACDPDDDNDLVADEEDCQPKNPDVKPGAAEMCNSLDDDCDGLVDEGYNDTDFDGIKDCDDADDDNDGHEDNNDCAPLNKDIYPGSTELCDGLDNDCDTDVDEFFPDTDVDGTADCVDADLDGDGKPNDEDNCPALPNEDQADLDADGTGDDCDPDKDGDAIPNGVDNCVDIFNPWQKDLDQDGLGDDCDQDVDGDDVIEVDNCPLVFNPTQEDIDNDGVGDACDDDADGDGDPDSSDCKPDDPYVFAAAVEECDGMDNNCDGLKDEGFPDTDSDGLKDCIDPDDDNDGDGDVTDCADNNSAIHSGAAEICNGLDDDCDKKVDEDTGSLACGKGICFHTISACVEGIEQECDPFAGAGEEICDGQDNDCDGQTDEDLGWTSCGKGLCFHTSPNCADGQAVVCNPFEGAAPEVCDGTDNDCNGGVDEAGADGCSLLFQDADGDGHGQAGLDGKCVCGPTGLFKAVVDDDCNDLNPWVFPGATELCDKVDNNCDEVVDEDGATGCSWFFADADGDGYGSGDPTCVCTAPGAGWSVLTGDCDENDSAVHPGALELCDEGDNDCDDEIDETFDLDSDSANCGKCGFLCQPNNAFGKCQDGKCKVDDCVTGYANCDGEDVDGCETNIHQDADNCGICDKVCSLPNATAFCQVGECEIAACNQHFADDDGIAENGCEQVTYGISADNPGSDCQDILNVVAQAEDGIYWIDPDGEGGIGALKVYCDMTEHDGGWIRLAKIGGSYDVVGATYVNGFGSVDDDEYVIQCSKLAGLGLADIVMRVNMGIVRDFFKPHSGANLCQMLSESPGTHHLWSNDPDGGFVQPPYYSSHLGGCKSGWPPKDNRQYVSFWGGNGPTGGCCALDYDTYSGSWSRDFEVYVR